MFSQKLKNLIEFYPSKLTFYRKPEWPVWCIRTTFMRYLSKEKHVLDENSLSQKITMSRISGYALFGQKKASAGCPDSKTKVVNVSLKIPDSIRNKLCLIFCFHTHFDENQIFSIKNAKSIEIVAKANLRYDFCHVYSMWRIWSI